MGIQVEESTEDKDESIVQSPPMIRFAVVGPTHCVVVDMDVYFITDHTSAINHVMSHLLTLAKTLQALHAKYYVLFIPFYSAT